MELTRKISNSANTSYATAYAQLIVDHFAKALQENGCMIQVPAALYIEFDDQYNRLIDYVTSSVNSGAVDIDKGPNRIEYGEPDIPLTPIAEAIKDAVRKASNDCFNCKIEKPKFDFSGIFGNLMADIQHSLGQFKGMFKYKKASVCQYAFFLSYLCIPDLLKLISLILAAIVKLMQNISLPRITIAVFISGILSAIIEVLTRNISVLARFALTPVLCILDAIDSIISQLPTPENIRAQNAAELKKLGLNDFEQGKYDTGLAEKSKSIREAYESRVRGIESNATLNTQKYVQETLGPLEESVNKAVESLNNSIAELTGLLNHFTCEPERSGITVSQYLSNLSEFMALVNLLRYIVKFKAGKAALEKLCNTPKDDGFADDNDSTPYDNNLSVENVGSIIADVLGTDIDIITNTNGDPIAIGIKDPDSNNKNTDNLSFWSCNLDKFAQSVTVPAIINEIIDLNLPTLDIPEWNPSPWTVSVIPETEYTKPHPNTEIVPLVIDEVWNLPEHIKDIVSMIDTYNGATNPKETAIDVTFLGEGDINDIIKNISVVLPYDNEGDRTLTGINDTTIKITSSDGEIKVIDKDGNIVTGTKDAPLTAIESVDRLIANFSNGNNYGQLDCIIDIENITKKLGDYL